MSFSLEKKGKILFTRDNLHWWLTGFKLGEFSQPSELTVNFKIILKDEAMRNSFVGGLKDAGYLESEIIINGNTVSSKFSHTHTPQPSTRTKETDWIMQMKNKLLCDKYNEITAQYDNSLDKIRAVKEQSPELYEKIINMGRNKKLYEIYEKISSYLS